MTNDGWIVLIINYYQVYPWKVTPNDADCWFVRYR